MPGSLKILMLEDSIDDAEMVHRLLSKEKMDFEFNLVLNKAAFVHALDNYGPGVILADNSLPQFSAREALEMAHLKLPDIPFIMVTGSVSEEFAADIVKRGADDYILKDRMKRLPAAIDTAVKQHMAEKDKKAAQEESRKSEERFQTLSRATKDAIWDWDLVTDKIWWNDNFYRLLGYDPLIPAPGLLDWTKRIHPGDRNKVMARLKGVTCNAVSSWEDEFRLRMGDGSYGTVLDRGYVLRDEADMPVRVIGALVNITEQKSLVREMEVLSLIARASTNSVIIFDRQLGGASWVNLGFTRCTGYSQQEIYKKDPWLVMEGSETDGLLLAFMEGKIHENLPFSCDLAVYAKSGEKKWLSLNGQPLKEHDGNSSNYFVIASDISERRRMEKERNMLGRELHDTINQILASVNLKLGHILEMEGGGMDLIGDCRKDLVRAIEETRNLIPSLGGGVYCW